MRSNYVYLSFAVMSCLFCACHNSTIIEPKGEEENIVSPQNANTKEPTIFGEANLSEGTAITNACENLQAEYALLIEKINGSKDNKQLISELIAWTKKPSHLNCLDSDLVYNAQIERLNETL